MKRCFTLLFSLLYLSVWAQNPVVTDPISGIVEAPPAPEFTANNVVGYANSFDQPGVANLSWAIDYAQPDLIKGFLIEYKSTKSNDWSVSDTISPLTRNLIQGGLPTDEGLLWKVHVLLKNQTQPVIAAEQELDKLNVFVWWQLLIISGSLGLFIFGMKMMSEGLQKVAGSSLRKILRNMTSTRLSGVFTGFFVTSVIQSSSATTVMVVSFVNAGLITLGESLGVIMGANIGTTVTAWLIAILGFKTSMSTVAIILIGIFFPFLFSKKTKIKHLAEFVLGFGILFLGLQMLKEAVPDIKSNPYILDFLSNFTDAGFWSLLFFVGVGTLLTVIIQSSSATMAITLIMLSQGWIDFPIAAAMVLGENIGTTITANVAAMVANVHAKRAASFHFLFNIFGVIWVLSIFSFFLDSLDNIANFVLGIFSDKTIDASDGSAMLAAFHTIFNILNVIILIWFVPIMEKMVVKMVKSKGAEDDEFRLRYLNTGIVDTPALSLENAREEMELFAKLVEKIGGNVDALLFQKNKDDGKIIEKIAKREAITDALEFELADFLAKVSEADLSPQTSQRIRSMLSIADELERIADIFYQIAKNYERAKENKIVYPVEAVQELQEMYELLMEALKLMRVNMKKEMSDVEMQQVYEIEVKIDTKLKVITAHHHSRLEKSIYSSRAGIIYQDFVNRIERIGNLVVHVNEAVAGLK